MAGEVNEAGIRHVLWRARTLSSSDPSAIRRSVRRLIPLGFLSPRIIEAIAEGRQPVDLDPGGAHPANRYSAALERPKAGARHDID
jgi:hypothetical protein